MFIQDRRHSSLVIYTCFPFLDLKSRQPSFLTRKWLVDAHLIHVLHLFLALGHWAKVRSYLWVYSLKSVCAFSTHSLPTTDSFQGLRGNGPTTWCGPETLNDCVEQSLLCLNCHWNVRWQRHKTFIALNQCDFRAIYYSSDHNLP